jgi:hypothetical protein
MGVYLIGASVNDVRAYNIRQGWGAGFWGFFVQYPTGLT